MPLCVSIWIQGKDQSISRLYSPTVAHEICKTFQSQTKYFVPTLWTRCVFLGKAIEYSGSFHFLDQSFAETKDWDQTAQPWSQSELSITNQHVSSLTSLATHRWFCRISWFIFELAKKLSDFRSSKLSLWHILALDSAIAQSEVWSQRIAQRKRLHFLADLWS